MTIFVLKIIACISMILDHIKYVIPETINIATLYLGRIAFPLFAFIAVEGYLHTSDLKRYIKRLIIFGLISQIPYMLFKSSIVKEYILEVNVIFTLLLGIISILIYEKSKNKYFGFLIALILCIIGQVIKVDYGWYGVGLVFLIYLIKNNKIKFIIFYILYTLLYYFFTFIKLNFILTINYLPYMICSIIPVILMIMYNGKLGKKLKYFYYWFYPIHMLILFIVSKLV